LDPSKSASGQAAPYVCWASRLGLNLSSPKRAVTEFVPVIKFRQKPVCPDLAARQLKNVTLKVAPPPQAESRVGFGGEQWKLTQELAPQRHRPRLIQSRSSL